jgi:hypothetical protein
LTSIQYLDNEDAQNLGWPNPVQDLGTRIHRLDFNSPMIEPCLAKPILQICLLEEEGGLARQGKRRQRNGCCLGAYGNYGNLQRPLRKNNLKLMAQLKPPALCVVWVGL